MCDISVCIFFTTYNVVPVCVEHIRFGTFSVSQDHFSVCFPNIYILEFRNWIATLCKLRFLVCECIPLCQYNSFEFGKFMQKFRHDSFLIHPSHLCVHYMYDFLIHNSSLHFPSIYSFTSSAFTKSLTCRALQTCWRRHFYSYIPEGYLPSSQDSYIWLMQNLWFTVADQILLSNSIHCIPGSYNLLCH